MDGLDLGGIFERIRPILPTLSYYLNMITKAFEIFASYLGFDLNASEDDTTPPESEPVA